MSYNHFTFIECIAPIVFKCIQLLGGLLFLILWFIPYQVIVRSNNWFLCFPFHVEWWGTNQLVTGSVFYFIYSKMCQINFFWTKLLNDAQLSADLPFFFVWFCSLKEKNYIDFCWELIFNFLLFMMMLGNNLDGNHLFIVIHCITLSWFEPCKLLSICNLWYKQSGMLLEHFRKQYWEKCAPDGLKIVSITQ